MPVEENGTPGTAATNPIGTSQPTGAISDLGDILLDKSLDTMQKNDFVAVTKNDVANLGGEEEEDNDPFARPAPAVDTTPIPVVEHATIEDLQNIMLDTPKSESPFSAEAPKEVATENIPVANNDDFNLGDIGTINPTPETPAVVETVTPEPTPVAEITTPNTESNGSSLDFDLGDIGVPTPTETVVEEVAPVAEAIVESTPQEIQTEDTNGSSLDFDLGDISTGTETVVEETAPVEEVQEETDNSSIDLGGLENLVPEAPVVVENVVSDIPLVEDIVVPVEEVHEETNQDIVLDTSSLEVPSDAVEATPIVENNTPTEVTQQISPEVSVPVSEEILPVVVETPVPDTTQTPDVGGALDSLQSTVQTEVIPENIPQPATNPEAVALEKVAEDITQGIDLDSLMVDSPTVAATAQVADAATANQTPTEGLKAIISGSNGNQKKVLIGLGAFALIGLVYFGYVLLADSAPSVPTPQITTPTEQNSGDTMDELSGDVMIDDIATGDTDELSGDIMIDDIATGDSNTGSIDTGSTTPIAKTPAEVLSSAKDLAGQVRKALIKATVMKNAQMRLSAFGLQKDVEAFIQELEKSNDMTTVSDSETKLNSLSQRLDTILQKLDGNSQ